MISPLQFLVKRLAPRVRRLNPIKTKLTRQQCRNLKKEILFRLMVEDYTCRLSKPRVRHKLRLYGIWTGRCFKKVWK